MGAWTAPGRSHDGDGSARARFGALRLALRIRSSFRIPYRPSRDLLAIITLIGCVAFVGGVTWYAARTFSGRAAEDRAAGEATSFATHSGVLATGDAFEAYLQLLRYAEDPAVHARGVAPAERAEAMRRLQLRPKNLFSSLTVASLSGAVFASTDPSIRNVSDSPGFLAAREELAAMNSDVILSEPGRRGYVEFSTPIREPGGGVWAIFIGRADPEILWRRALTASVDGSRNVLINGEGKLAAGVPAGLLGGDWHGQPVDNGAVRAEIAGVGSICGLAPIGRGTQIDRGGSIASCLPVSLIASQQTAAQGKQALVTAAACVLAAVAGALALAALLRRDPPLLMLPAPTLEAEATVEPDEAERLDDVSAPADAPAAPAPASITVIQADVDAATLIDAYERRAARLAEALRDAVTAPLLVVAAQLDEAQRLREYDADAAAEIERKALADLDEVRDARLRALGQELHPSLVRLGLPAALTALQSDLEGEIAITLDVDPNADAIAHGGGRLSLAPAGRLALYRLALDSARSLAAAGASACTITLRTADNATVELRVDGDADAAMATDAMEAHVITLEAFGGSVTFGEGGAAIRATLPPQPDVAGIAA